MSLQTLCALQIIFSGDDYSAFSRSRFYRELFENAGAVIEELYPTREVPYDWNTLAPIRMVLSEAEVRPLPDALDAAMY